MTDNKMFFRPLFMNIDSWIQYTTCEGECNECEQFDLCRKVVYLSEEIGGLFTAEEIEKMRH